MCAHPLESKLDIYMCTFRKNSLCKTVTASGYKAHLKVKYTEFIMIYSIYLFQVKYKVDFIYFPTGLSCIQDFYLVDPQ